MLNLQKTITQATATIASLSIGLGSTFIGLGNPVKASSYMYQGKCGFLMSSNFTEKCNALFSKTMFTLMPKGSRQIRIWPQQISYVALATRKTLKMDEDLVLWKKLAGKTGILWWKRDRIPQWVLDATAKESEDHQFSIGYVDRNKKPQILLFVLNDREQASGMINMLESYSGLSLGQNRLPGSSLGPTLTRKLAKEATRKARRLAGLCSQYMFEDAEPIASELDSYVENTIEEISIFSGTEDLSNNLLNTLNQAMNYCDTEMDNEIIDAHRAREKARIEQQLLRAKESEEQRIKARAAFDMLAEI